MILGISLKCYEKNNEVNIMRVLVNGPTRLIEQDKTEIFQNILDILERGNEISLFLKSTFEIEVLRLLLTYMKEHDSSIFTRVTLYTLYPLEQLPSKYQTLINFATQNGASWSNFSYKRDDTKPNAIDRKSLTGFWRQIVQNSQLVLVFLDDKEYHQLIPLDIAMELKIEAVKLFLFREGKGLHQGDLKSRTEVFRIS